MENKRNVKLREVYFLDFGHSLDIRPYDYKVVCTVKNGWLWDESIVMSKMLELKEVYGLYKVLFVYEDRGDLKFCVFVHGIERVIRKLRFEFFCYTRPHIGATAMFKINYRMAVFFRAVGCVKFSRFFMRRTF